MTSRQPFKRLCLLLTAAAMGAWLGGCDGAPSAPPAGAGPESRGDPNATVLPADARAAYGDVMKTQVNPEFANMGRALANDDFATISAGARSLLAALGQLQQEYGAKCPGQFVTLQKQFRNQLSAAVEFSDGPGDRTQLERLLGTRERVGEIEKTCGDCHARYREN